jgi:hypothetical protein
MALVQEEMLACGEDPAVLDSLAPAAFLKQH